VDPFYLSKPGPSPRALSDPGGLSAHGLSGKFLARPVSQALFSWESHSRSSVSPVLLSLRGPPEKPFILRGRELRGPWSSEQVISDFLVDSLLPPSKGVCRVLVSLASPRSWISKTPVVTSSSRWTFIVTPPFVNAGSSSGRDDNR